MKSFADIMFRDAVAEHQKADGSFERMQVGYANRFKGDLDEDARAFIESRTSFYIASRNADGWPYMQHRGGPAGFLKVTGPTRLAMADYKGNRQFVTRGHLDGDDRVALFLMDYPRRARLKLLGRAAMVDAADDPDLVQRLSITAAPAAERLLTIDIEAMDWNCPKYITPRFTEGEIAAMLGPKIEALSARNAELEAEITDLKRRLGAAT